MLTAADGLVTLSCNYPGGNVKIVKIQPGCAEIAPDLRDNRLDWFYWNFDAVATQPGTVHFCFPKGQSKISAQGPAVSTDGGKTWQWLGKAKTHFRNKTDNRDHFEWTFTKAGEKVRFAQGIPYQKERFEAFYEQYKAVPHMKRSVLTKTRKGVDSPMLIVGSGPKNILVTARHHACEAIASYVLEGFVTEALSESPAGKEFRKKYTLYVVPFIDLDGVEAGDQGKNRAPHDHNRDYALGDATIYPEIKALQALDKEKKFFITLDMHAPSIRNDIHEAIYFAGFKTPSNKVNTAEFKAWLDAERPAEANAILVLGGGDPKMPDGVNGVPNAHYFATNPTTVYGMIEIVAEKSLAEAVALEDGTAVVVKGTVSEINGAWSEQYGNMNVTISDGTDTLYLYRLSTNVKEGDVVTVVGKVDSYKGSKQLAQGCFAIVEGGEEGGEEGGTTAPVYTGTTFDVTVLPVNPTNNGNDAGSYVDRTSEDGWVATGCRVDKAAGLTGNDNPVLTLNGKTTAPGTLKSPTIANGIAKLSFKYGFAFGDNQISLTINVKKGDEVVATTTLEKTGLEKNVIYDFAWDLETAVEGEFVIEVVNNCKSASTSNKDRLAIWDFAWVNAK